MALATTNSILDAGLNMLSVDCDTIVVCSSQPLTFKQATEPLSGTSGCMLAMSSDDWGVAAVSSSDFTPPANSTRAGGGRKLTTPACTQLVVCGTSGTANYIAMVSKSCSGLLQVTACVAKNLTTGDTVSIPAYRIEFADPTTDSEI